MRGGGVHRLYVGKLTEGNHALDVSLSGRLAEGKAFNAQRSLGITKMPGRKTVELQLGSGKEDLHPDLTFREWQQ